MGHTVGMPRPVWSGTISFGLVAIPIKLFHGVSKKSVSFNQLDERSMSRIRLKKVSADTGDDVLYAGVAVVNASPEVEKFTDTNGNGLWDDGEPYDDVNKNGKFDAYWMAGFDTGRLAYGVNPGDGVWARALALKQNQTTVVLVAVDSLGLFADETTEVE